MSISLLVVISLCFLLYVIEQYSVSVTPFKKKKKRQEKDEKEKKNERRRNQYARVRRYKITSTLGLLVRGDPQNEGLRGLQPRALGSKLDYFHAGITSTRLHRLRACRRLHVDRVQPIVS